jgi:hypothetical protein
MDAKQRPQNERRKWSKSIGIAVSGLWEKCISVVGKMTLETNAYVTIKKYEIF